MADRGQGDAALTRFFIDVVGIDVHTGFPWCTARLDGRGVNGVADDEGIDGYDTASTNDTDVYLTPLATAALFGNAAGVEALLRTPNTNFAADLVPETGLPPLHAAMVGVPVLRVAIPEPGGPEPSYQRLIRFIHDNKVFLQNGQMHDTLSNEELEAYRAALKAASIADRAAYIDARVATVQLLTAEAASICQKSFHINAAHSGYTPLHLGARFDRLPLLRVLLDRGADPRIPIPGGRSVFTAVVASIHRLCTARSRVANDQTWHSRGIISTEYKIIMQSIDARVGEGMTALLRDILGGLSGEASGEAVNEADADGNTASSGLWATTWREQQRRYWPWARAPMSRTTPTRCPPRTPSRRPRARPPTSGSMTKVTEAQRQGSSATARRLARPGEFL